MFHSLLFQNYAKRLRVVCEVGMLLVGRAVGRLVVIGVKVVEVTQRHDII